MATETTWKSRSEELMGYTFGDTENPECGWERFHLELILHPVETAAMGKLSTEMATKWLRSLIAQAAISADGLEKLSLTIKALITADREDLYSPLIESLKAQKHVASELKESLLICWILESPEASCLSQKVFKKLSDQFKSRHKRWRILVYCLKSGNYERCVMLHDYLKPLDFFELGITLNAAITSNDPRWIKLLHEYYAEYLQETFASADFCKNNPRSVVAETELLKLGYEIG